MAVVKSNVVTTEDTVGSQVDQGLRNGAIQALTAHATPASIADNDVILLGRIPVNAKILSVRLSTDDWGTTGDANIGLYKADGSTISAATDAVDEDAIGSAIDCNAAALANVEQRFETKAITTIDDKAWELAGLSAEPEYGEFYLAITAAEAATGSDIKIAVIAEYTV